MTLYCIDDETIEDASEDIKIFFRKLFKKYPKLCHAELAAALDIARRYP